MNINIHANPNIPWQKRLCTKIQKGLKKHNLTANISTSQKHTSDIAIILGPNYWKSIERSGKPYIMMNRKFLGYGKNDVHDNVCISWDGFNGRGTFCVEDLELDRLRKYIKPEEFEDWREPGNQYLLCKQTDLGRSTKYPSLQRFYHYVKTNSPKPVRIRSKVSPEIEYKDNTKRFLIEFKEDLNNVKAAVVLNSTVSVDILLAGIPVISMDEGDPCYAINSHKLNLVVYPDRLPFLSYLAHCQWHYDEIESGKFWDVLYPKRGKMLCEWSYEGPRLQEWGLSEQIQSTNR